MRREGLLLVEDFAFDAPDEATLTWLLAVLQSPACRKVLADDGDDPAAWLLTASDPVRAWHQAHDHSLHRIETITRVIEQYFVVRDRSDVPYLYRYLVPMVKRTKAAAAFVADVLAEEAQRTARREILAVGRRLVATPRDA